MEKALGAHLPGMSRDMEVLADCLLPAEPNQTGFRLFENLSGGVRSQRR